MQLRSPDWLAHPRLPVCLAVLALLLTLPALWVGWQMDDHFQRLILVGGAGSDIEPGGVFSSLDGDPETNRTYIDMGILPWWTVDTFRLSFFRYLSVFTAWVDYRLWPESAALMHAHSLLWLGALVVAAAALYRRILGQTRIAGLAAVLFALDDAHAIPAAWLANRNILLATFFGLLCVLAHDRWRRGGERWGAVASPVFLGLGLCSGEAATGAFGYLLAHALFLDGGTGRRRVLALAPASGILLAWGLVYHVLGFGASGSGLYVDPLNAPLSYAVAFVERAPLLLMGQWTPVTARVGIAFPGSVSSPFWWVALGILATLAVLLFPLLRREATARFWCVGMLLALFPIAATFPAERLLFLVGVGAMGLLAQFLGEQHSSPPRMITRSVAILLVLTHLVLAPLLTPALAYAVRPFGERMLVAIDSLPRDGSIEDRTLVVVNAPDYLLAVTNIRVVRLLQNLPAPKNVRGLVTGPVPVNVTRLDENTLRVHVEGGLLAGSLGTLFRDDSYPFRVGDEVRLSDMTASVATLTPDGRPEEVVFRFAVPLEDPSLLWVRWKNDRFATFAPPAAGETVSLEAAPDLFDWRPRTSMSRMGPAKSR
jgi:hypothetical protein